MQVIRIGGMIRSQRSEGIPSREIDVEVRLIVILF
ncbi:hypothetical protein ERHA54_44650 [Erwinia rhapontici]|nr:hypothetical protein ERHA54_44650 [Erwinia rhapontici]